MMGAQNESIEVKQVHDNDKYIIKRVIIEEVNGEELLKIYGDIEKALNESVKQLGEIPKQVKEREKLLESQVNTLKSRIEKFERYAVKLGHEKEKEELTKKNSE